MLTQDPQQRAATFLKGATKPLRIFVGYSSNGRQCSMLSASLDASRIKVSMPRAEFTVPHTLDVEQLAQAIEDQWARLRDQLEQRPPIAITATPDRRHHWRGSRSFARKRTV